MMTERFTITTPIYYVNGLPHIGHAYTSIAADVLARWKRLDGFDVFFLTGTDEHGQKVEQAAIAAGLAPQQFVDRVAADFRAMADALDISYDDFVRTTEPRHLEACAALWRRLEQAGHIYEGAYVGWYALRDESFYGEDELVLHADGTRTAPTGAPVQWLREPSYFFRLAAWQDRLLAFYDENPDFIGPPARRNEIISFVRQGLNDLSISRTSFDWGVPVPGNAAHVMYVWWDALVNYITALGYPDETQPRWRYWPADLHLIGKEIARFHGGRARPAQARLLARMVDDRRREDEQVGRQRDRSARPGGRVRRRRLAVLPAARGSLRRRRRLQPQGVDRQAERRSGQ